MGFGGRALVLPDFAYSSPASAPGSQAGWDTFSPPVTPLANVKLPAHALTVCTPKAAAAQQIQLCGDAWDSTTYFAFYGQTTGGNGTLIIDNGQVLKLLLDATNRLVAWVVPYVMPAGALMVWPVISMVAGLPLIVNTARVWRSQDMSTGQINIGVKGGTVSVYGMNLCNASGATWIYLEASSGAAGAQFFPATAANEDRVQFTMPSSITGHGTLAVGDTVRVWIHNGRGDIRGWSKLPIDLIVVTLANLGMDYSGITGTTLGPGTSDDTVAFQNAMNSRKIILQAGTYRVNWLNITAAGGLGVSIEGAGVDVTFIKPVATGFNDQGHGNWLQCSADGTGRFLNLTVDATGFDTVIGGNGAVDGPGLSDHLKIVFPTTTTPASMPTALKLRHGGAHTYLTVKAANPIFTTNVDQVVLHNVTIIETDFSGGNLSNTNAALYVTGNLTNYDFENWTVTQDAGGTAVTRGRIYFVENQAISGYAASITSTLTPVASDNGGEQIALGAQAATPWTGLSSDSSGTYTTVTFPTGQCPFAGHVIQVVLGKGIGQSGTISSVDGTASIATLDQKWLVDVNTSSTVHTSLGSAYNCIRDCSITGGGSVSGSASTGFSLTGANTFFHAVNNTISLCNWGFTLTSNDSGLGATHSSVLTSLLIEGNGGNSLVNNVAHERHTGNASGTSFPVRINALIRGMRGIGPAVSLYGLECGGVGPDVAVSSCCPLDLFGHDGCFYIDVGVGYSLNYNDARDVWWNTSVMHGSTGGTTVGLDLFNGVTGANLIIRGTGGILGFSSGNRVASP